MASTLEDLLQNLRQDSRFSRNVTVWRTLPPRAVLPGPWPSHLDPRLRAVSHQLGIDLPYTHQSSAIDAALSGNHVALATATASGKTLGYVLPILHTLLQDPAATALLLFPTKALAHDQLAAIEQWARRLDTPIALRTYDGDTPQHHRAAIRKEARILISNPDMVHLGILPHHTQWMRFFQGLRYIVVDELHTYRGVFGSHVANVLRRLRRIARFYGSTPHFVAASATISNPKALAEGIWEDEVSVIEEDGAPYGERHLVFYNPPLVNPSLGLRASAAAEALSLALRLLQSGVQTIVFARSRLMVELLLRDLRQRAADLGFDPQTVQGYRGGYLPHERREIERGLRSGRVRTVVATNALELGIDIGALDASILVGYPGTIAAARQQMGRAGRRAGVSLSVMIATPSPLDQYLVGHPEYFFGRSPEEAFINPDSLSLLSSHLMCAAFELPFQTGESFGRHMEVDGLLEVLSQEGLLHRGQERFTWIGDAYPAQLVSLRSATPDNVVVHTEAGGIIGTIDRPSAPMLAHEGAQYFHSGESYTITSLDWERGVAIAQPSDTETYTVASASTQVERIALRRAVAEAPGGQRFPVAEKTPPDPYQLLLADEEVLVRTKPTAYRRVHLATHETLGWGEIDLPEQVMDTEAFRLVLGPPLVTALAQQAVWVSPLEYGPEWPAIRAAALERDGRRCRLCGSAGQSGHELEVHHLTSLRTFLSQYPRALALRLAHASENLLTLCPPCHHQVERSRGARTALSGLAYLLINLAPVFLMCDPQDLGKTIEARDRVTAQPAVVIYDAIPGGAGLAPRLVDLWDRLAAAALDRVSGCPCIEGCPSCVGPVGESELGAKEASLQLLKRITSTAR